MRLPFAQKVDFNDFLICFVLSSSPPTNNCFRCIEADRDIFDWSGKKPLDYQKQLTSISASTFSSEYKVMSNVIISNIQTLPTRQNTMKKSRNRERSGVQRSFTIMNDGGSSSRGSLDDTKSIDNFDTRSIANEPGTSTAFGSAPAKRKEKRFRSSFLKKSMSRKQ